MAVADVYNALISKRVYKLAFSHKKAMSILLDGKGTHFDPCVIQALIAVENEFQDTANKYRDQNAEMSEMDKAGPKQKPSWNQQSTFQRKGNKVAG
jgi:HD-GYP domain-containing protein (c-di-GMP phosphodiesterase class II)